MLAIDEQAKYFAYLHRTLIGDLFFRDFLRKISQVHKSQVLKCTTLKSQNLAEVDENEQKLAVNQQIFANLDTYRHVAKTED